MRRVVELGLEEIAHRRGLSLYQYRPQGHRQLLPRRVTAPWIGDLPQGLDGPEQIDETAHDEELVALSTYHNHSFCLGVASCELKTQEIIFIALQSRVFYAQYRRSHSAKTVLVWTEIKQVDEIWVGHRNSPGQNGAEPKMAP